MKEDYLWDKSGTPDPEIEKLENALQVFRYKETQPPALPANNVVAFKNDSKNVSTRRVFSIPMTIAASVALMAVVSGLWFFISNNQKQAGNNVVLEIRQEEEIPWAMLPIEKTVDVKDEKKDEKNVVLFPSQNARNIPHPKQEEEIKLTDEERYAYEQLMKALKITSDKLNYIKQKTQGKEEEKGIIGSGSD